MTQVFVTLTKDMRPWRENDRVAIPLELAEKLVEAGEGKDLGTFPDDKPYHKPTAVERLTGTLTLGANRGGSFKTKGKIT